MRINKFKDKDTMESALVDLISGVVSLLLRGFGGFIYSLGTKHGLGRPEFTVPHPALTRATSVPHPLLLAAQ